MIDTPEHRELMRLREAERLKNIRVNQELLTSMGLGQGLVPLSAKAEGKRRAPQPALAPVSTRVLRMRATLRESSKHSSEESGEECHERGRARAEDGEWDCAGADRSERSSEERSSSEPPSDDERRRGGASAEVARRPKRVRRWHAPVVLPQGRATAVASAASAEWAGSVRLQVTRPAGAASCQVTWTADAAAPAATSFPARGSNPCTLLTAEQCYSAARAEGLVLDAQDGNRGGTKLNATGFVGVLFKATKKNAPYFAKVREVYLGYYDLPVQAALAVARYRARVQAALDQVLLAHLGPVQGDAARVLGGDETEHADAEVLQAWCYQRGLDMSGNVKGLGGLKHRLRAYTKANCERIPAGPLVNRVACHRGKCADPTVLAAAAALRATLTGLDDARRAEGNDAVATRASHVMGAFDRERL